MLFVFGRLKLKNKGHANFSECGDLTKIYIQRGHNYLQSLEEPEEWEE